MKYITPLMLLLVTVAGCNKDEVDQPLEQEPVEDVRSILLRDMIVQGLPSPYYHFEYNTDSFITKASFSSGVNQYDISYVNGRIDKMQNNTDANHDKLQYSYTNGRVNQVNYINEDGRTFKKCDLTYNVSGKLAEIKWDIIKPDNTAVPFRSLSYEYYADGNLSVMKDHRFATDESQPEALYIDTFEEYDDKPNIDGFSFLHRISDHLLLLPGVALQKNNPRKEIRSGDGINYAITYTYTYNNNLATRKDGDMLMQNGTDAGKHFSYNISFSYY